MPKPQEKIFGGSESVPSGLYLMGNALVGVTDGIVHNLHGREMPITQSVSTEEDAYEIDIKYRGMPLPVVLKPAYQQYCSM